MLVALISTTVAAVIGATAGYFIGVADKTLMWVVDLLLVLPSFLIIAILSPMFRGKSWCLLVFMLAAFQWMITARIVRGMTLTLKEREFVKAAKFMGQPARKIIAKHIVPNMASLLIIDATINVGSAVLAETGLSYFGFGVQSPDVSLGTLIGGNAESATTFPWLFLFPAGFLVVFVLAVNWVGDGLRDALDPTSTRVRQRGEEGHQGEGRLMTSSELLFDSPADPVGRRTGSAGRRPSRVLPQRVRPRAGRARPELPRLARRGRSASSASPVPASPCPRSPSWACCRPRRASPVPSSSRAVSSSAAPTPSCRRSAAGASRWCSRTRCPR